MARAFRTRAINMRGIDPGKITRNREISSLILHLHYSPYVLVEVLPTEVAIIPDIARARARNKRDRRVDNRNLSL